MNNVKVKRSKKIALITTDLQYDLVNKSPEREKCVAEMMPHAVKFIKELRNKGICIIHQQLIYDQADHVEFFHGKIPCLRGSDGVKFLPEIEAEKDIIIEKRKDSGFYETNLHEVLQSYGVDTIMLAGMQAQICIQTTAADGYFRGYNIIAIEDCITSTLNEDKQRALDWIKGYCGKVMKSVEILDYISSDQSIDFPVIYTA